MSMEETLPATYAQRQEMVAQVLALFHREKQWYLNYFATAKLEAEEGYLDVGLIDDGTRPAEERDWLVRFSVQEDRIVSIWRHDDMLIGGMSTGLKQVISIPDEIIEAPEY